ncbi:hypothetical protein [Nitrososphaera sp. AFS]|uniref:hypothetical protein n=1 Tax=Nitrososphaera sp. AFS TaxID=2301191 RepID=UPI001392361C|nr:hypothetical protein [Nitrososphaera sp. AFS]
MYTKHIKSITLINHVRKHTPTLILAILAFGSILASSTIIFPHQNIQKALAANMASTSAQSTNSSSITLGSPQIYTEYDKTTSFKPAIVNGTHGIEISFVGHGILNGSNITDNGKAFTTNGTGGVIYTIGHANAFNAFTFQGIGHYGADGKLRDIGTIFNTRGLVGIYKDEIDKNGNAITKIWFWK